MVKSDDKEMLISLGHDNMIFLEDLHGETKHLFHESKVCRGVQLTTVRFQSQLTYYYYYQGSIIAFACNPGDFGLIAVLKNLSIEMWRFLPAPSCISMTQLPDSLKNITHFTAIRFIPYTTVTNQFRSSFYLLIPY